MKKSVLIIVSTIFICGIGKLQAQKFEWAGMIHSSVGWARGQSTIIDQNENIYTTGYFVNTSDFDPGPAVFNLSSYSTTSAFIQKLDSSGNFIWAKKIGGPASADAASYSMALDYSGNIYMSGYYVDSVDFDPGPGSYYPDPTGYNNVFVLKLDSSGNFIWVKTLEGGYGESSGQAITVDTSGNIYATGYFRGIKDFDPDTGIYNISGNFGLINGFVWKLSANGNLIFAKAIMNTRGIDLNYVTLDDSGNIYTTGSFKDSADFDPGPGTFKLIGSWSPSFFIEKLDTAGNFVWVKRINEPGLNAGDSYGVSIAFDASGNIYSTGAFKHILDFDPGPNAYILTSVGDYDAFILKLNPSGNFIYAKQLGGASLDDAKSITVGVDGNIYLTGSCGTPTDLDPGPGTWSSATLYNGYIFILKLDSSCNFIRANMFGNVLSNNTGRCIQVTPSGTMYVSGQFYGGPVDFDPGAGNFYLSGSASTGNTFVLKLSQCAATSGNTISPSVCNSYTAPDGRVLYSTGNYVVSVPNVNRCDSTININLTVNPDVIVSQSGAVLTANATAALYQWIDCNNGNNPIAGETNQTYTAGANGNFAVIVTENGCTDTSTCYQVTSVGIGEMNLPGKGLTVYPNPVNDKLYVTGYPLSGKRIFVIYDLLGKELLTKASAKPSSMEILDMSSFPPGMYFLAVYSENGLNTYKVIKQ